MNAAVGSDSESQSQNMETREDPGVGIGDIVKVLYLKSRDTKLFTVRANANDLPQSGTQPVGIESPLGQAIEGLEVNDEASFMVNQQQQPIRIVSIQKVQ